MLVSVVIPVYKVEKYLRQCLDSVLAQTYRELEMIVVDDGSPDGCPAIIDEYAARDSRIVAIHQQNGGYGKAVNAGIARARGKYIGIVESDDYIEPDMYARLAEAAERTGADLTRCTFSVFDGTRDSLWSEVEELNRRDGDVINPHEELDYFHKVVDVVVFTDSRPRHLSHSCVISEICRLSHNFISF
jgi:glycosyltransferase involved in cell wall biosynthesis